MSHSKQRYGEQTRSLFSRRTFLGALGGAAGFAGCLGVGGDAVSVLSAGSLARTLEEFVGPAFEDETGITVHGEFHGSNAVMRMVEDRTKHPDVVVSADATLLRDRLYGSFTEWDVEFAGNTVGLGYDASTAFGQRLDAGEPWYRVAREADGGDVAIGDPELDPLGYRAVQAFELAGRAHGLSGFRDEMVGQVYTEPDEPQLLAGIETGSRVAAVVYRNMALDHGVPFLEFPEEYSFGNPDLADHYATATYTTETGYTAGGRPVVYSATVNSEADNPTAGARFVQFLVDNPDPLVAAGLTVGGQFPRPSGAVPQEVDL